jgi:hypothetical protein
MLPASYPCSHSFNEHSRSKVSRSEAEGEEWVRGGFSWEAASFLKLPSGCMREPTRKRRIPRKESLLQSIIGYS